MKKNILPTPTQQRSLWMLLCLGISFSVQAQHYLIPTRFSESPTPQPPNYSLPNHWSALPTKQDPADLTPRGYLQNQEQSPADVFFIHPTTFLDKPKTEFKWNQDIRDEKLNLDVDNSPTKFQASAFNLAG